MSNPQTNPAERHRRYPEPEPVQRVQTTSNPAEDVEAAGTPDAIKESESRRAAKARLAHVRGRGVDWVRPTDLFAQSGGVLSRRGIDLTTAGGRRLRAPIEKSTRWVRDRARQLPPLSAFGHRSNTDQGQLRSGVGMR